MNLSKCFCRADRRPTVYVLIRLYWLDGVGANDFVKARKDTIDSVIANKSNNFRRLVLLVNDDSPKDRPGYADYAALRDELLGSVGERGTDWMLFDDEPGMGSAYAMYRLRRKFIEVAQNDSDIAITLDQDDLLCKDAARRIARSARNVDVVITPFELQDNNRQDITDDGGRLHNKIARRLSCKRYAKAFVANKVWYWKVNQMLRSCKLKKNVREQRRHSICDLSSIGWTKSYSKGALKRYMYGLNAYMHANHGDSGTFFSTNRAYEDFIDYYVLLLKNIHISGVRRKTHIYRKNATAITSNPQKTNFTEDRPEMMLALIGMCYHDTGVLRDDFKPLLLRYVASKTAQIRAILYKYHQNYKDSREDMYKPFGVSSAEMLFVNSLCRKGERLKGVFDDLLSMANYRRVVQYDGSVNHDLPRQVLLKAASHEAKRRSIKSNNFNKDEVDRLVEDLMAGSKLPHETYYRNLINYIVIAIAIFLIMIAILVFKSEHSAVQAITSTISAVSVAVITFFFNERGKMKLVVEQEKSTIKLYCSEFKDLMRHFEANIKIMLQLREELAQGRHVIDEVHFGNMAWPESSQLFSDEMLQYIPRTKVDDFARLKVNLRNANNSAKWLRRKALMKQDLSEALDWELTRAFGYLINLYYMTDNEFSFQSSYEDLTCYVDEYDVLERLQNVLKDDTHPDRSGIVDYFYNRYLADRKERRAVLVR